MPVEVAGEQLRLYGSHLLRGESEVLIFCQRLARVLEQGCVVRLAQLRLLLQLGQLVVHRVERQLLDLLVAESSLQPLHVPVPRAVAVELDEARLDLLLDQVGPKSLARRTALSLPGQQVRVEGGGHLVSSSQDAG